MRSRIAYVVLAAAAAGTAYLVHIVLSIVETTVKLMEIGEAAWL